MRKFISCFVILVFLLQPSFLVAQSSTSAALLLKEEQASLLKQLDQLSIDSIIVYRLSRFINSEVDSIRLSILNDKALPAAEKEKATRSLFFFVKEISDNLVKQKFDVYDIPGALESYKIILKAVLNNRPFSQMLMPLAAKRSQLLAAAFAQYKESPLLNDIAVYKRVASAPEFILQFLESKPAFRYADSLVLIAAIYDPLKFAARLDKVKPDLRENIRNTSNVYVQKIVLLSEDKNASELLPFVTQLKENILTPDSILKIRMDVIKYFQLLVNTQKEAYGANDPSYISQKFLHKGLKEKSVLFYANQLNELHSSADAVRFESVKGLRPEDLYYIITSAAEELYTSSYLGLYKRLMEHFKQNADSLFDIVHYDNFRTFMRLAANYNVLGDFLTHMPQERAAEILKRFISGIESDINTGLEKAMDVADAFTGLGEATDIVNLIQSELQSNLKRCEAHQQYFGIRLYTILLQVFDLVKNKNENNLDKLWSTLGNYDLLQREALQNKNKETTELVLFYGDDDGKASFNSFQKLFTDTSKWKLSKNESWVTIRSVSDEPVIIYANLPLDNKEELDEQAQENLFAYLDEQSIEPTVLIHRGHSYHLDNTLKRLRPSVRLAILGSCGAHNSAISIATINQDVQIIGSKKTGAMSINDPIINEINETLLAKKDLQWSEIWEKLRTRFSKDESTLNLFNEYIPPAKNVSLFVLKLFNYYNRFI